MPCMTIMAASTSVPAGVRPSSSQVKDTHTGLSATLLQASTAARASAMLTMVSMKNRSTPAAARAAACSVYTAVSSSKLLSPKGARDSPSGPRPPATRQRPSAARRVSSTSRRLYSATW